MLVFLFYSPRNILSLTVLSKNHFAAAPSVTATQQTEEDVEDVTDTDTSPVNAKSKDSLGHYTRSAAKQVGST